MGFLTWSIIHLFLLLQLQTPVVLSQNIINGSVLVGESLTASESQQFSSSWRYPSGDFALGFRKIRPNNGFTLSIWFDKIPDKTIVWHAQAVNTNTGFVPAGSKVTLTADGGLVLTGPRGQLHWSSSLPPSSSSVSRGLITDVGEFGLFSQDSTVALWSSFDHPTDTLLPTQSLEIGNNLPSRLTETSFKKGRFRLHLFDNGDLQLLVLNSKTLAERDVYFQYYKTDTKEPNPGTRIVFNQSGHMYVLLSDNSTRFIKSVSVSSRDDYLRAVLHFDGVFAQYSHSKGEGSNGWESVLAVPENICRISKPDIAVGNILEDTNRPKCQCPERFSLLDTSDEYGDCKADFEMQTCGPSNNNTYELIRVDRTNWPYGDYQMYKEYDEERCRQACLDDCFCAAVVFGNDRVCWAKKFPLSYGQRSPNGENYDSRNSYTLIKVLKVGGADAPSAKDRGKDRDWLIIACSVLLGTSAFVNFIFLALYGRSKTAKKKPNQGGDIGVAAAVELNLRVFTYDGELLAATGDFMEELGRGAFGIVYKGFLKLSNDSEVTVAVKKLDRVAQENEKEFKNEVKVIGQIHHKNLVRLIGFCNEGHSRMIVYEFIPHGTLANFLFRRPRPSWEDRRRISIGIARGILYLHEECSEQIIHCDIKPQNILLDEYYNPRISDFGLAKLLMMDQTHTLTNIRGTKGYVAPEWFRNSPITSKVDVYSYGVMLLETVCCKKAVDLEDSVILIDWAYYCYQNRRLDDLIQDDLDAIDDMEMVERYVKIGIWCIQEEPRMRPNMRHVTQMLDGVAQVHDPPNPFPYSTFSSGPNIISGSVPVGESLTASESQQFSSSWLSPSGDFAFGFRKIQPNDGFTLSIWFDKIPDKKIVWYAQTVNTTTGLVPDGSKVTLTADRGLVLTDPGGQQLWSSSLPQTRSSVSRGLITDAGNLRLLSEDSDVALWSSFANPTDTLLPTQSIEVRGNLSSRLKETSFQKGRFRLRFDDGDLQLLTLNSETLAETDVYFSYYSSNTKDPHNPGNRLVFNETGYMYVVMRDNTTRFYVNNKDPVPSKDFYHRAVLHFDGVFAQYYHPKRQGVNNSDNGWSLAWSEPENICAKTFGPYLDANELGNLACGFNNICILGYNHRPRCECPERFLLVDPSDEYGDCKPDFEMQTCGRESNQTAAEDQDANLYEFVTLRMTNWPSGDYKRYSNYDEERCKATCLKDCFCGAVVLGRDRLCWKKKFPLSYGIRDTNGDRDTFIKVLKLGSRS
uniref:non-specific serine/threonine protein kinase n=1 Tax=Brassica oleracea var. oleracea TaxID=109376 RepID=A0A0D3E1N6_BRAOL